MPTGKAPTSSAAVIRAYAQMTEEGEKLRAELAVTNQHLGVLANAVIEGGKVVRRWLPILTAIALAFFPTISKIVTQTAERAGVIQEEVQP
jgi:hypothetical protein